MADYFHEDDYDLDVEMLIALVEERPVLWDKSLESYKSKTETSAAWREICTVLNPNYPFLTEVEKDSFGKALNKRWTNLRDRYKKYLNKVEEHRAMGCKKKPLRKYIYSDQMTFLLKNSFKNVSVSGLDDTQEENQSDVATEMSENDGSSKQTFLLHKPPSKKRTYPRYSDEEKEIIMNKLREPGDRHLHFFKGILPSLQLLSDDEVIRFQSGVLNVLQDIHRARQYMVANPGCYYHVQNMNQPSASCHRVANNQSQPSHSQITEVGHTASPDCSHSESLDDCVLPC